MSKKPKLVDAADASVKAMNKVKAAVGAVGRALGKSSRPPSTSSSHPSPAGPTVDSGAKTTRVRFEVEASTDYGEMVCVVGDHSALGAWDPARAVPLDATQYPTWSGRVEVERGRKLEYKYVRRQSDGSCAWEDQAANRVLTVPASGRRSLDARRGQLDQLAGGNDCAPRPRTQVRGHEASPGPDPWPCWSPGWRKPGKPERRSRRP